MYDFETDVQKIQHSVLKQTAEHVLKGRRDSLFDEIPRKIIPGPNPQFRCCVYRERAIIQDRVKLVVHPISEQIVHVIRPACEQCPIHQFEVSSACQGCISKHCKENCPVGAISFVNNHAVIDHDKCIECGRCAKACPFNAITEHKRPCKAACPVGAISVDVREVATIDESKCINCGRCIVGCPFGAIGESSFLLKVLDLLMNKERVNAVIAPSAAGQYADATLGQLKNALKRIGFGHVFEVAMGADITVEKEAHELMEHLEKEEPMTTSCCPSFVQLIHKHYPNVIPNVSLTPSPMAEIVRKLETIDPDAHTVFIGPCVSKKAEMIENFGMNKHFVLTYMELDALFDAYHVSPVTCQDEDINDATRLGRSFPWSGGVSQSVVEYLNLGEDIQIQVANGAAECIEQLKKFKNHRFDRALLEGMVCQDGCLGGPGCIRPARKAMKVAKEFSKEATKPIARYDSGFVHNK